jgi:hypothetical protein
MGKAVMLSRGDKFNMLTFLSATDKRSDRKVIGLFKCDCGKTTEKKISNVVRGKVKSCGCFQSSKITANLAKMKNCKFGNLTFTGDTKIVNKRRIGLFRCECGNFTELRTDSVFNGSINSCGCLKRNLFGLSSVDYEKLFDVWQNMKNRCYNESSERYYTYGARGISVCEEWKDNFHAFAEWAVKNGWKPSLSIERKDLDEDYCPDNCTFITMKEQARNKTNNVRVIVDGVDRCIAEWCEILGLSDKTIYARYYRGIREPDILLYNGDLRDLRKRRQLND